MQVMGLCCSWCSNCYKNCYGDNETENNYLFTAASSDQQPIKTVRRISSVGQTLVNDDGEEIEMPRHSSILQSYNGVPIPWSSSAVSVQPGVSKLDLEYRLSTMPTISEIPQVPKSPKRHASWKLPIPGIRRKDYSLTKSKDKPVVDEIQLKRYTTYVSNQGTNSQEDFLRNYQSATLKPSHFSSPNLVDMGQVQNAEKYSLSNQTLNSLTNISLRTNLAKSTTWLHSRSLEDVNDDKATDAEQLARQYGLDLSLYKEVDASEMTDKEILNLHDPFNLFDEQSSGFIEFSIYVNDSQNLLSLFIGKVGGLSGIGQNRTPFAVLLKVSPIPNKNMIKSSKKIPPNLNPIINRSFTFLMKGKQSKALRVSVYNAEFLGRFDAVGHSLISLDEYACNKNYRIHLYRNTMTDAPAGMLQIFYQRNEDKIQINVLKVFNLLPKFKNYKIYAKISYYCLSRKSKEKMSSVIPNTGLDKIEFNHQGNFRVDLTGRKHNYFVISLKKRDTNAVFKNDETIGRVYVGPDFYSDDGKLTPWGRLILHNEKMCFTHKLYL